MDEVPLDERRTKPQADGSGKAYDIEPKRDLKKVLAIVLECARGLLSARQILQRLT